MSSCSVWRGMSQIRWLEERPSCCEVVAYEGETMREVSLPECLGTVVIHRYDAVTCTMDTCPRDMALESWFSHHTSFMMCKTQDCPHCSFSNARAASDYDNPTSSAASRRRGRLLLPEFGRRSGRRRLS
jgi:hypothetical protein